MTNQQGAPNALRSIARYTIGYATDDWGVRSSTPGGIPDPAGAWVRYKDHVAALVEAQPPAPSAAGPREAPEGWRNQFAEAVYADLEAADNHDVPLEEYPTRILKVLDSIVGPRHPTVIYWRNDAIQACIAIAYKYCRDPESFQYLKQDLQALIFAAPTTQAQAGAAPLTDAQWQRIADLTDSILTRSVKDEIERVIGIKGGQHGTE